MPFRYAACSYLGLGRDIAEAAAVIPAAGYTGIEWRVYPDGQIRPDLRRMRAFEPARVDSPNVASAAG